MLVQKSNTQLLTENVQAKKQKKPPSTRWFCGDCHFTQFCLFKKHKCSVCCRIGHEDFCNSNLKKNAESPIHKKFVEKQNKDNAK